MDIFTTQLARVVPVPIKPTSLKVKALVKDAASAKLKEDHDHLENHDYYFISSEEKSNAEKNASPQEDEQQEQTQSKVKNTDEDNILVEGKDHKLHLDIFI